MHIDKKVYRQLLGLVVLGVVLNWLLSASGFKPSFIVTIVGLFYPFLLGTVFAYLFNIPMMRIERQFFARLRPRRARLASFGITLVLVLLFLGFVVVAIIPGLIQSVVALAAAMPGYLQQVKTWLAPYLTYVPMLQEWVQGIDIDRGSIGKQAAGVLQTGGTALLNGVFGFASSVISGTVNFIIAAFFSISLLLSKEGLLARLRYYLEAFLPQRAYTAFCDIAHIANVKFTLFVAAECVEALVLGILYFVAFSIGGFRYALLISVLAAVLSFVPLVGGTIGLVLGGFLTLVSGGFWRLVAFLILFLFLQRVESSILYKRIVGESIGLSSTWMLIALTLGGGLFGIPGVLFFVPLTSLVYTLVERAANKKRAQKGLIVEAEAPLAERLSVRDTLKGIWKR